MTVLLDELDELDDELDDERDWPPIDATWVGDHYWTHGPIVLASDRLRRRWRESLSQPDALKLTAAAKSWSEVDIDGERVIVLPRQKYTTWIPLDSRSGYLVRQEDYVPLNLVGRVFDALEPVWFEGPWRKVGTLEVEHELHLFDVSAPAVARPIPGGVLEEHERRGHEYFVLELDPGTYAVHESHLVSTIDTRDFELSVLRLRRQGHVMPVLPMVPRPAKPEPLAVSEQMVRDAEPLEFVGTDGAPFVLIHESDSTRWHGAYDETGVLVDERSRQDSDLGRASVTEMVAVVEGRRGVRALAIPGSTATAFHRTLDGGVFIRWVGADSAAGCLAATLGQPEDAWRYEDLTWEVRGPARLIDASGDGRDSDFDAWPRVDLAIGHYLVATAAYDGLVRHPDGAIEDLIVVAIRLRGPLQDG